MYGLSIEGQSNAQVKCSHCKKSTTHNTVTTASYSNENEVREAYSTRMCTECGRFSGVWLKKVPTEKAETS